MGGTGELQSYARLAAWLGTSLPRSSVSDDCRLVMPRRGSKVQVKIPALRAGFLLPKSLVLRRTLASPRNADTGKAEAEKGKGGRLRHVPCNEIKTPGYGFPLLDTQCG